MNNFPAEVNNWLTHLQQEFPHLEKSMLDRAWSVAKTLSEENAIPFNEKIDQSLLIANQLLALNSDIQSIIAAIIYPFFKITEKTREFIAEQIDPQIYKLLIGTKRMETIDQIAVQENTVTISTKQVDNLRRMLLAIVDDVRIVLIKIAERLATLILLRKADPKQQQAIARQSMTIYAPLANRLGIGQFKWQLEDWCFRYLNPTEYNQISKNLNLRRQDREYYIKKIYDELSELLKNAQVEFDLCGRAKHIYSIYRKINRKQLPFEQIYDTHAFRILVRSIEDCYKVLSIIHEKWPHVPQEFDDYIVKPKPNGYQSIHTVIIDPDHRHVEIQIRTVKMDAAAELGIAAHWKYKEEIRKQDNYEGKINLLRDIMKWQKDLEPDNQQTSGVYNKLFEDRIYIFTPQNEIIDLPAKATPLDAAYHIHTQVGHCCRGAKVNGKIVTLTHPLQTGDQVEILTAKNGEPSRDWLNQERGYITTRTARSKVKAWFIHQLKQEKLTRGHELWEKAAKREGLNKSALIPLLEHFNFNTLDDLFVAIGIGHIGVQSLIRKLKPSEAVEVEPETIVEQKPSIQSIPIAGNENLLTKLARCCNPIPGDKIIGYITQGRGVSIHRTDCRNIRDSLRIRRERLLEINWSDTKPHAYPVEIEIEAIERSGLIRDISGLITNEHLRLLSLHSRTKPSESLCYIRLTVELNSLEPLKKLLQQIQQIPEVIRANRRR